MENNEFQFKTNINCGGCVAAVKSFLDKAEGIQDWNVDTDNKDKILTIQAKGTTVGEIMETVQKAGFKIEPIA